ncbi:polymorphic toxin-type HINT domain-containing protein [Streptomyces sp. Caat 7-52]|uniref:polymorphic toxin-type HINT domain-containing protein n=1 Tax=Streptomyces sp. Caat 7-52 TaxID=2949637 RepID=UPI0020357AD8|nr:polymorphic toxin-type HINT domain-containing protein [Streptomyces sp. Caat 7-52]
MPTVAAALLVGLLPTQSQALPPDPNPAQDVPGRETVELEHLESEEPVPGKVFSRDLDSLRGEIPEDQLQAPAGTTTAPSNLTAPVNFGAAATTPASLRSSAPAEPAAMSPAGTLPVSLGQAPDQPAPTGTWQVTIPDRTSEVGKGIDGAVLKVQAPASGAVPVSVKLDYSKFESLYGADWASRLRFVQFPECYLTTPDDEACQTYEELETSNDTASKSLTATVDPAADGTVTPASAPARPAPGSGAVQAAYRTSTSVAPAAADGDTAVLGAIDSGSGSGGSFAATPLASDGKWEVAGSSGAFTWSYPLTIPSPPAGPAPKVSFDYSSQTVDGRTAVSSPQASWIGEGWTYDPGYIERRYRSCKDDRKTLDAGAPNNTAKKDKTSDLCWVSYNAVMSLNGRTTELVRDAAPGSNPETDTETYRPQQDDGTRIEHKVGGSNDDNNGEYWLVTTRDGTKYYYGLDQVAGGHADTDSVSTVPVFGNHPGEPCHATDFADSRCGSGKQQAWRWGLDKVVDVHGNTMVVSWKQETNYYAVRKKFKSPEQYDRYAYPTAIEYGMRSDLTKPSAKIEFGVEQRCLKSATACDPANFAKTDDPGAYRPWWDTPGNLNCKATSKLCPAFPSFWTQLRLDTVTTKAARAGQNNLGPVDKYTLHQSFPEDWYDTAPGLWLNSLTRTGYAPGDTTGTLQSKDGVSFSKYTVGANSPLKARLKDRQLPNMVLTGKSDQRPGFTRPRIGTVSTEYGGDIEIEYTGGCASEPAEDKGKANGTCYPVRWSPDGDERTPKKAWFNKYVVASVTETDKVTSHGKPVKTAYAYSGPAWAKSDDEFIRPPLRTYSDWKGYRQVSVRKGSKTTSDAGAVNPQSYTVTRYFQGVGGAVKDSTNTITLLADDAPQYAGMTAENLIYVDSNAKTPKQQTLTFPESKQTASRARENEDGTAGEPLLAHRVDVRRTDVKQTVGDSWRTVRTLTTSDDTYGLPLQQETAVVTPDGTGEALSDQSCTTTTYVHNTSAWLIGLPKEQRVTGTSCAAQATADPAIELTSAVRNTYDDLAYGTAPAKGLVTSKAEIDGTGTAYSFVTKTTYDPLGRVRTVTAPGTGTTETQYTPGDEGGPVTAVKSINAKGHTTTTTYDPGRGLALTVTDPNGRVTRDEYDALGRLVKGWSPSRSSSVGASATVQISYQMAVATSDENRPAAVTVQTLKDDGTYTRQITLYDGLQRQVQKQSEAHGPGRIITDTFYDDHGLIDEQTSGYLAKGDPATELFAPRSKSLIPSSVKHRYDGLEREVRAATYHGTDYKYATSTTYSDDSTLVDPAGSSTPRTQTYFDALGRVTSIKHYTQEASTAGRSTRYDYDARGNRSKVTDSAGNVWSYVFDARGRITSATDPDTGTTDTWYDDADRPNRVRNARKQETFTEYDPLGRPRYVRQGSATATPVREYTYDDLPGGIGKPTASIRHTSDGDYVNRVTGYDSEYHVTGTETVIPANSLTTGLSGTYAYSYTYTPTGKPLTVTLPAKGGLASEKIVTRYNSDGLPESTSGLTWYTSDTTYSPYGEILRTVSAAQPYRVWTTNFVDPHTGRLQRTVTDRESAGPHRITDGYYSYDASGTITSQARELADATGETWDTQCFTYDVLGELAHAWTSKLTPAGNGTGCKAANGTIWGPRTDYAASSGPITDAPDQAADTTAPDAALTSALAAAAPDTATVSTGATAYHQSFTFDWLGNRATLTDHDTADPTKNLTYTYGYGKTGTDGKTQPHTATSITSTPSGKGSTYTYDATGNTEVRTLNNTTQNLLWSPENKLETITDNGKKTTYVYDADGNRLLENSASGSTLYLGETELTTDATGTITRASRSYAQSGAPTVVRTTTNGAGTGHKLSVLLTDHLGTANTSVDVASGQAVTRRAFKPYGEVRGTKPAAWPNKRSYLGTGIDDTATGLTHIGAREYDQNAGRFLSADPVIDITDPLQINGYTYARNSPVSTSDPDGLRPVGVCDIGDCPSTRKEWFTHDDEGRWTQHTVDYAETTRTDGSRLYTYTHTDGRRKTKTYSTVGDYGIYHGIAPLGGNRRKQQAKDLFNFFVFDTDQLSKCNDDFSWSNCGLLALDLPWDKPLKLLKLGKHADDAADVRKLPDCNCFLAGTDVLMANGSTKDIEDVKLGDKVLATDPKTGETVPRKVTRLIRTDGDKYFNELSIATKDGIEKLTATHEHPFWSPSRHDWVPAGELAPGMTLRTEKGDTVIVTDNHPFTRHTRTYNLTVDDLHAYYVLAGETPVLVHNSNCPLTGGFKAGVTPDEITDINRGFGGETLLSGSPANTMANASRYNSFWDKSAVVIRDIAGSHMFNNGNKRTAQAVVEELMRRNRVTSGPTSADLRSVIDRVGKGQLHDVSDISAALRGY